jgi:hypothetical protein
VVDFRPLDRLCPCGGTLKVQKTKNQARDQSCRRLSGTGICKAVTAVFAGAKDFICHFHFLRGAGKDLLEPASRQLRGCLRQHAFSTRLGELARQARQVLAQQADARAENPGSADCAMTTAQATYALALWCLQAKNSGDGYGFPFDRPLLALAERVLILLDCLPRLLQTLAGDNPVGNRLFSHLARKVLQVAADPVLEQFFRSLRRDHRRCTGDNRMHRALQTMLAETPRWSKTCQTRTPCRSCSTAGRVSKPCLPIWI